MNLQDINPVEPHERRGPRLRNGGAIVRRRRRKSRSSWRFATGEGPALARTQPALQFAQELNNPTGERNKPLILGGVVKGSRYSLTTRRPSDLMCRNRHSKSRGGASTQ
jgi:hypothetical protein